jgi:SAM-dependent methyltransferase
MSIRAENHRDWFHQSFDEHYKRIYSYKDETALYEVEGILKYLKLRPRRTTRQPQRRLLDLACGWGRHSIPLAARGFDVTGVDISEVMLAEAKRRALVDGLPVEVLTSTPNGPQSEVVTPSMKSQQKRHPLKLLQADMRSLPFEEEFDAVIDIFTSFGYFRDAADNEAVLDAVRHALKPGGRFLLDVDNPEYFRRNRTGQKVRTLPAKGGGVDRVVQDEEYQAERRRRVVTYTFMNRGADKDDIYLECVLYGPDELRDLLDVHGFQVDKDVWGDFGQTRLGPASERLILVATKR